jgi:NAD(P)-dependent dehydrogenase (short-subunit alcohol dehydrogenase family)
MKGADVTLACRNAERGEEAVRRIARDEPEGKVELMLLDLSSLESVRNFAAQFKDQRKQLDLLINNAGVMVPPYSKTAEGFELQFGTNHLGHFVLSALLMDPLLKTEHSRLIMVSSVAHKTGNIDFDDLNWEKRKYKPWRAYGDSKIANLYFMYELSRRLAGAQANTITAAAHPGWTATNLQQHSGMANFMNRFLAMPPLQGALPTLRAATDPAVQSGDYYGPHGIAEMRGYPKKVKSNARSRDEQIAARLWKVSEELTGVAFSLTGE